MSDASSYAYRNSVSAMASSARSIQKPKPLVRRQRGEETVGLYSDISPEVDATIKHLMEEFRIPQWAVLEEAIKNIQYGRDGRPVGWNLPEREELPIPRIA